MGPQNSLRNESDRLTGGVEAFAYWGKANPAFPAPADHHPLPYHALDVAAVGDAYLRANPALLEYFSRALTLHESTCRRWLVFWLALHDLGKFSTSFQNQRADLLLRLQKRKSARGYGIRHDTLGLTLWHQLLVRHDPLEVGSNAHRYRSRLLPWITAVTGHHGQPPGSASLTEHFDVCDETAAAAFVRAARSLLLPDKERGAVLALPAERLGEWRLSWWLSGLAVLADWLGSNTDYFPYRPEPLSLDEYWRGIQSQAECAVRRSGVLPAAAAPAQKLSILFGWDRLHEQRTSTPLQVWSETVPLAETPQLFLLEDVTGAGKTEAALALAQRLMAGGLANGLFVGLPTMATANAMYERVASIAPRLFAEGAAPSMTLAHSKRGLLPAFRESVLPSPVPEADALQVLDETASARCAAWLADSNKKALLANVGVGTLDQAMLGVLHAKHQSLRLLGLFGKVLIVDEVHACDAYMQAVLERLLSFHAAAGGSAILLSATLPQHMKQSLVQAWTAGGGVSAPVLQSSAYPLATQVAAGQVDPPEHPLDTRPEVRRRVAVVYLSELDEVYARIRAALTQGRCVCWIRNTVADALAAWEALKPAVDADSITLFHARFVMGDRLDIEAQVLSNFGPDSGSVGRRGRLIIATQVIEQSLDVDFDVLISDLAPIDRLIQRAGRLQRHTRALDGRRIPGPDARGGAILFVYGPSWSEAPASDWYRRHFPGGTYVYSHTGQLWLTARFLMDWRGFSMPEDARALIEGVFGEDAEQQIPEALQQASVESEGRDYAATNLAAANRLDLAVGYRRTGQVDWAADGEAPPVAALDDWSGDAAATRLGELTVTVRLARWDGVGLRPWRDRDQHAWEASSLRLPARLIGAPVLSAAEAEAVEQVKQALPDRGRWSVLLPLSEVGAAWKVRNAQGRLQEVSYNQVWGFTLR